MNIKLSKEYFLPASIVITALVIAGAWIYTMGLKDKMQQKNKYCI